MSLAERVGVGFALREIAELVVGVGIALPKVGAVGAHEAVEQIVGIAAQRGLTRSTRLQDLGDIAACIVGVTEVGIDRIPEGDGVSIHVGGADLLVIIPEALGERESSTSTPDGGRAAAHTPERIVDRFGMAAEDPVGAGEPYEPCIGIDGTVRAGLVGVGIGRGTDVAVFDVREEAAFAVIASREVDSDKLSVVQNNIGQFEHSNCNPIVLQ